MQRVTLDPATDFDTWREHARRLALAQISPAQIEWSRTDDTPSLFDAEPPSALPAPGPSAKLVVRPQCLRLLQSILRHNDPQCFALAYRILWRTQSEPALDLIHTDPDIAAALRMDHQIRRDAHKMKAFVRFREQPAAETPSEASVRRRFISWFEPEHYILPLVAPFFAGRFTDMDWLILTPKGSIAWNGQECLVTAKPCAKPTLNDGIDQLWHTYYRSIFNPARIKTKAMRSEMPRKYWKNLPETQLIPAMLAEAEQRVAAMAAHQVTEAPRFHHKIHARPAPRLEAPQDDWTNLLQEARQCRLCPLHCHATQLVFGEGPEQARWMMIGEQPGDQEDLQGRPFVGPAGSVLDAALAQNGLDRQEAYLTNAVKHFKFVPRGKRRIHQTPNAGEISACRTWLAREIELVRPQLLVTLGATALSALGKGKLSTLRGRFHEAPTQSYTHFATVHPSYLLRLPDPSRQAQEKKQFQQDFNAIARWLAENPRAS
ncbi:UdgX family uracil-DNA binding protein [Kozakia baliensis]|uniref:UdgX family uracil-DNA binding protein n=1 Tax=Kozakia baliensis TaxID=153496 RepID=UPI00087B0573|nr:UdgX family uracil-DNA binding protein [Kozakia baliensis]AOX18997.1 hypothetical protein A0U90_00285 [Kozakia baliensis]